MCYLPTHYLCSVLNSSTLNGNQSADNGQQKCYSDLLKLIVIKMEHTLRFGHERI